MYQRNAVQRSGKRVDDTMATTPGVFCPSLTTVRTWNLAETCQLGKLDRFFEALDSWGMWGLWCLFGWWFHFRLKQEDLRSIFSQQKDSSDQQSIWNRIDNTYVYMWQSTYILIYLIFLEANKRMSCIWADIYVRSRSEVRKWAGQSRYVQCSCLWQMIPVAEDMYLCVLQSKLPDSA